MAETVTNQLQVNFNNYLSDELVKVEDALPKDFNRTRFVQNCVALLNDKPELKKLGQKVVPLLVKGAYLGLDYMNNECYLVPYGGTYQFQTSYIGECKFVKKYSIRPIKDIYAKVVREGDSFEEKIIDGKPSVDFKPIPFSTNDIVGVFAVCLFDDGGMIYETMSMQEVQDVRKNYSKAKDSPAWKNSLSEMTKKVCLRRLTKHIETDFETMEARKAWEDGADTTFVKKPEASEIVSNPFETENVVDVEAVEITEEVVETEEELPTFLQ